MITAPVAFLGPQGTFAHSVAKQRHGERELKPFPTVDQVFDFIKEEPSGLGIVPVENSSGGTIYGTVDLLIENAQSIFVQEELSLDVRLCLAGQDQGTVRTVYSHFAPLEHHKDWLKREYSGATLKPVSSTAMAALAAAEDPSGAAICGRDAALLYGLKVLKFPIVEEETNVTHFFAIGQGVHESAKAQKTALVVGLRNDCGSLCSFLAPFGRHGVNLTRIVSRPVHGHPNSYLFYVEIEGGVAKSEVAVALREAAGVTTRIDILGSFESLPRYQS